MSDKRGWDKRARIVSLWPFLMRGPGESVFPLLLLLETKLEDEEREEGVQIVTDPGA